jgi:hypothetical protein
MLVLCFILFLYQRGESMKNRFVFWFVLAVMVFSLVLPVSSVEAATKTATLVDIRFVPIKGWAVVFNVTGDWKGADLKGNTLSVGGHTFNLYCNFKDDGQISCTMESLGQFIGKTATIFFGGNSFVAIVPPRNTNTNICAAYSFETEEGWFYIWADLGTGLNYVNEQWEETVIPASIHCYTDSWEPNDEDGVVDFYMDYVGGGGEQPE